MQHAKPALLIFVKNPEKGNVKTRLAQSMGDQRALAIYRALLDHTRSVACAVEADRLLFYSKFIDADDEWPEEAFTKFVQRGKDLGARMLHAFQLSLQQHDKAVIIGSDCASLTPAIIEESFQALDHHDFVLGPAMDGGYYLLGMREVAPSLFQDMEWSTDQIFPTTMQRIRQLGKTCHLLPELSDIDYEEDWEKYGWDLNDE